MGTTRTTSTGRRSRQRSTSHHTHRATSIRSLLRRHNIPIPPLHLLFPDNVAATEDRPRCWTSWTPQQQLADTSFLKVPTSTWKNIHTRKRSEWMTASEDTLTKKLAAGATLSKPIIGLIKVHKWFWDRSIETYCHKDTYRYRVIDHNTNVSILPEDDEYYPFEDDESRIKILLVGLSFEEHLILLLRRVCPDASMEAIGSEDKLSRYLAPSIRAGLYQVRRSTSYGWGHVASRKKKKRRRA